MPVEVGQSLPATVVACCCAIGRPTVHGTSVVPHRGRDRFHVPTTPSPGGSVARRRDGPGRGRTLPLVPDPQTPDELADALAGLLTDLDGPTTVTALRRLSGGASRETWSFTASPADRPEATRPLILQRLRGGGTLSTALAAEDALLAAAARAGVPVPAVVADAERCGPLVGDGRISEHVDGEALGPRIVRDERYAAARRALAGQCGRALAAIHAIDPADAPGLQPVDTLGRLRVGLDGLGEARPAFELALRWLHENQPPVRPTTVVHGDFRVGNLLVDETGLRAVLDWELSHLGDPVEDLGWLCVRAWRFGGDGEVGGVGDLDDLLAAYRDASGTEVGADEVRWWIVVGTLTWGLICAVQAHRHLDGHVRSVELATIGRRICETEYDLLDLLGLIDDADPGEIDPPVDGAGQHGRPTAAELVDAVREHLTDRVAPELSGAAAFHLKVAGNALGIVERELRLGPAMAAASAARFDALGLADEAELAAADP